MRYAAPSRVCYLRCVVDALLGVQCMTPSYGRGLDMDGVFLDTYDTRRPYTDPSLPNFSKCVCFFFGRLTPVIDVYV